MNNEPANDPLDQAMAEIGAIADAALGPLEINTIVAFMRSRIAAAAPECDYTYHELQIDKITGIPGVTLYRIWGYLEYYDDDLAVTFATRPQKNQIAKLDNGDFVELCYQEIYRKPGFTNE
jgi:hypothetical protein